MQQLLYKNIIKDINTCILYSNKNMDKFTYLLNKNKEYKNYIFIGSLCDFQNNSKFSSICSTII